MNRNKLKTLVVLPFCFLVSVASLAWACTVSPLISLRSASGPGGTTVSVAGEAFAPEAPVEIRWNDTEGEILGVTQGPSFSIDVQPPAGASPGFYYLVAVQQGPNTGGTAALPAKAAEVFHLTDQGSGNRADAELKSGPGSVDLWSGFQAGGGALGEPQDLSSQTPGGARESFIVGLSLIGGSAVTLFVGFGIARKRRPSSSNRG